MSDLIHGAEARVEEAVHMGRAVIAKVRVPKAYRHEVLDARLRAERTRDEASLLLAARAAGVPVPVVYDVDRAAAALRLERIEGPALRDVLPHDADEAAAIRFHDLGRIIARLHDAGLTHGDLTTSNILVPGGLVLIDFGLGQFSNEAEQRAVDLHLMEEALEATDDRAEALMAAFLEGYDARDRDATIRRLEAVRERGRYRGAT